MWKKRYLYIIFLLISLLLQLNKLSTVGCSESPCFNACAHVSHTCLVQEIQQGGPATVCNLQRVLDDTKEVVQETKADLQQKTVSSVTAQP